MRGYSMQGWRGGTRHGLFNSSFISSPTSKQVSCTGARAEAVREGTRVLSLTPLLRKDEGRRGLGRGGEGESAERGDQFKRHQTNRESRKGEGGRDRERSAYLASHVE